MWAPVGLRPAWRLRTAQFDALPASAGEVDDHLDPLGRPEHDFAAADRLRHQPALGRDLQHRRPVGELQVVAAEGGDVEQAQPVATGFDPVVGHVGAVDEDRLGEDPVGRRAAVVAEGVGELIASVEGAVADHQRQVAIAIGSERESSKASSTIHIPARPFQTCGAVRSRRWSWYHWKETAFGAAVLGQVVDVGFASAGLEQDVVARTPRAERPRGMRQYRELGWRLGQAAGLAVELGAVVAAVEVDRELADLLRQLVVEGDPGAPAGAAANRRPGESAAVGPEPGLGAGEDLLLGLLDRDPDVVVAEDLRDRQPGAERGRGERRGRLSGQRHQTAAPAPQRQEGGKGAAAEGAEESSAPEAAARC